VEKYCRAGWYTDDNDTCATSNFSDIHIDTYTNREERIPTRCNSIDDLLSIPDVDY